MNQRTIIVAGVLAAMGSVGLVHASESREKSPQAKPRAATSRASVSAFLSRAEREAIVEAAITAVHKSVQVDARERNGDRIPRRFWGEEIQKLRPLRVINHSMNVMIVLTEDSRAERGIYVSNPISSHLCACTDPTCAGFELLSKPGDRSFGCLSRYHIKKKQSPTGRSQSDRGSAEPCSTESGTAKKITRL